MVQYIEGGKYAEFQMKHDITLKHYIKAMPFIFGSTSKKSASSVSPSFD